MTVFLRYPGFRFLSFFVVSYVFFAPGNSSVIRSLLVFVILLIVTVFLRYPGFRFLSFLSVLMNLFCNRRVLRFFAPGNFSVIRSLLFLCFYSL